MTFEWWFAYLLTSIILSLSPGSGAINTMTTSINHGYRGAAASIAGLQNRIGHSYRAGRRRSGHALLPLGTGIRSVEMGGRGLSHLAGDPAVAAAGSIDLNTLARTQSRGKLYKRAVFVNLTNPKKYRLPRRAVSPVHRPASAAGDAVPGTRRHHHCGRYH